MRKSIVAKVFLSVMTILSLTLMVQLVVQVYFMDDIYRIIKTREMEKSFEDFVDAYDFEEVDSLAQAYFQEMHSPILVLSPDYVVENISFFEQMNYVVVDSSEGIYKLLIGDRVDEEGRLIAEFNEFSIGNELIVLGTRLKGHNVLVLDGSVESILADGMMALKGRIIETHFLEQSTGIYSNQPSKLIREVGYDNLEHNEEEMIGTFDFFESETGLILSIQKAITGEGSRIYALFTMEDLSQTFMIINQYYVYLFLFQVILLLLVSYGYSKWITSPIKGLIQEAKDISELNFESHRPLSSGDELEDLSKSLGLISNNMSRNIEQLILDAKEKAESEARMRTLLASLSHEFKTPLGVMSGFLEMLEASDDNKDYYIETINEEINRLNDLTKETLLLCESENHQVYHLDEVHSLDALLGIDKFRNQLIEKGLQLEIMIENQRVQCDGRKIKLVIDNLMSNAIKYTPIGEKVYIKSKTEGANVIISIENTGVTFSEDDCQLIWQKYYRREKSRNKAYGGNGLGLSIVENVLKYHSSDYGVRNGDGRVIFYFSLKKV